MGDNLKRFAGEGDVMATRREGGRGEGEGALYTTGREELKKFSPAARFSKHWFPVGRVRVSRLVPVSYSIMIQL
jgi:hypothetical protein